MRKVVDVLSVAELDRAFNEYAMSDEEKARDYAARKVGAAFRQKYPQLELSNEQIDLIDRYVAAMNLPVTVAGIERAFSDLHAQGSL